MLIDEAHAMPWNSLEEVRLLSNLESNRHKLVQIVLFGQPELDELLARNELRQLRERITHNFALEPLHHQDIVGYIDFRLRAAGYHGPDPFTAKALKLLAVASAGLTRRINIVADKALLAAFAQDTHLIDTAQAKAAIEDAQSGPTPASAKPVKRRQNQLAAALGMLIVAGAAAWGYRLNVAALPETAMAVPRPPVAIPPAAVAASSASVPQARSASLRSATGNTADSTIANSDSSAAKPPLPDQLLKERIAAFSAWFPDAPDDHYFVQLLRTRADST